MASRPQPRTQKAADAGFPHPRTTTEHAPNLLSVTGTPYPHQSVPTNTKSAHRRALLVFQQKIWNEACTAASLTSWTLQSQLG